MPNQRQAWCVVAAMSLTLGILFGSTLSSFGVFTVPLIEAFAASNEQVANIPSFFMLSMTLAMPVGGWLLDRIGPRLVMVTGAGLAGTGYCLGALSQEINDLVLWVAISGIGVGLSTYVPAIALVLRWVALPRQGLAVGLVLAGGSLGAIVFPPLLTWVIEQHQWDWAMQLVSALMLLVVVPVLLVLARMPRREQVLESQGTAAGQLSGKSLGSALRLPGYWFWVGMQVLLTFSVLAVFINLVPYLIRSGYTPVLAASVFSLTSSCALLGHFVSGFINARWDARGILLVANLLGVVGVLALLSMPSGRLGYVALGVFALGWGATFNLVNQFSPMLMARMVGERHFATLLGIGSLIAGFGSAFSPTLVGYLLDLSQSYVPALLLCVACMLLALPLIGLLPGRGAQPEGSPGG